MTRPGYRDIVGERNRRILNEPRDIAVGDVRSGSTKRVAAAVGEGSAAVRSVHAHLAVDRHA
jgi:thioredoxin reductase (NADPH)